MKKRKIIIIFIAVIISIALSYLGISYYNSYKKEKAERSLLLKIKSSYSTYVETTHDKIIYKKEKNSYHKIGLISKNTIVKLDKPTINSSKDKYFSIMDTDYFIDYLNLKTVNTSKVDTSLDRYLITKKITTSPTILYQNDKVVWNIDEEKSFDVLINDSDNYSVKFLDQIYTIKSSYKVEDINQDTKLLDKISVINFSNDITTTKLQEILNYLTTENYYFLTIDDFKLWITGKISLPEKSCLLLSYQELDEEKKKILIDVNATINTNLDNISFTSGDTQLKIGDTTYYKYEVNSNTTIDRIKDILIGKKEIKPEEQATKIAVLNYHFFYDSNTEACNETICISTNNFKKQLAYLKENNYKTLTMAEFNDWMDGKINLPKKSVLITVDDGAHGTYTHLPQILEEYQMHATLFLITGWWPVDRYRSSYLEIESHGNELHHNNYCDTSGCGYKTLKLSKEEIKSDLQTSISIIGSNLAFCYPFYQTNSNLVQAVKESGFKLAFVGGNKKATRSSNKYYIPRYVVYKNTSLNSFIKMVSN